MVHPSKLTLLLVLAALMLVLTTLACGTSTELPLSTSTPIVDVVVPATTSPGGIATTSSGGIATTSPVGIATTSPDGVATISGMVGYPSEGTCPEMTLYARSITDQDQTSINWNTGTCEFSITVPAPGEYILFAWPVGDFSFLGFMVSADCVNPDPIPVTGGGSLTGIYLNFCPENTPLP